MAQWKILSSNELIQSGFIRIRTDECQLPDGRVMPKYYVIEFPDWVNVVALTPNLEMILIRQHRHAAQSDFLEIPGGSTHAGSAEDPRAAAERELLEETGYKASEWIYCGSHFPNPALQSNRLHTYVALNCKLISEPQLDPFEDLEVVTMSLAEGIKLWQEGGFEHSLISASIGLSMRVLRERRII